MGDREPMGDVTRLLLAWRAGDRTAYEALIPLVYGELHRVAERYLRRERQGHTLQPTALVHEAYLRLVDQTSARWQNRAQFVAVAAQAMRRILVDHARASQAQKRGGDVVRIALDETRDEPDAEIEAAMAAVPASDVALIDLEDALTELARVDPDLVRVVELRYFGGLTVEQTAAALSVSPATVKRSWATAKAWLFSRLRGKQR